MKKVFALIFVFLIVVSYVFSASLEELTGAATAARLRASDSPVVETQLRNPVPGLTPNHALLRQVIAGVMTSLEPNLAVETLYLYNKPAPGGWSDAQRTALFNHILALSTLTGIEYYSASRRAMRTFYESSVVINNPQSRIPQPDPVFSQPPETITLFARQKDLTFGDNIYRYEFWTASDIFLFIQENITPLSYGIITAVGRNRLQSVMAVIDCDDYLLIYAVSLVRTASIPGIGDRIGNSFGNRADAVLKWFTGMADSIFSNGVFTEQQP
jgi:hypothetical protein